MTRGKSCTLKQGLELILARISRERSLVWTGERHSALRGGGSRERSIAFAAISPESDFTSLAKDFDALREVRRGSEGPSERIRRPRRRGGDRPRKTLDFSAFRGVCPQITAHAERFALALKDFSEKLRKVHLYLAAEKNRQKGKVRYERRQIY